MFEHAATMSLKDPEIKILFQRLHQAYIDCVSNPFYQPNTTIKSRRFDQVVASVMAQTDAMASSTSIPASTSLTTSMSNLTLATQ